MGGSNGGLLVLATMLQYPKLFRAVISQVPVADMLRFALFTVGKLWAGEYGHFEVEEEFNNMINYSPLHTAEKFLTPTAVFPSLLITTADHDDRVVPLHSYKMISELQYRAQSLENQTSPFLIRIETQAGHGAGKPLSKVLDEYADTYAFLGHELNAGWHAS
jgi:prolyl oligopeptidase